MINSSDRTATRRVSIISQMSISLRFTDKVFIIVIEHSFRQNWKQNQINLSIENSRFQKLFDESFIQSHQKLLFQLKLLFAFHKACSNTKLQVFIKRKFSRARKLNHLIPITKEVPPTRSGFAESHFGFAKHFRLAPVVCTLRALFLPRVIGCVVWTLDEQVFKRCIKFRLQANVVNVAVTPVGVLPRFSHCAIEVRRRLCVDDFRCLAFAVTFHAASCSVEHTRFEACLENAVGPTSHVPEYETPAALFEIAEEEQRLVGAVCGLIRENYRKFRENAKLTNQRGIRGTCTGLVGCRSKDHLPALQLDRENHRRLRRHRE